MRNFPAFFGRKNNYSRGVTLTLLLTILVSQISFVSFLLPTVVEAAVVTIDGDANQNSTSHLFSGGQTVFISDQVGYKFFRDNPSAGPCVYRKTTNGGTSWGAAVTVDAQTDCAGIVVWYDQWTPGDFGNSIHIATMDTAAAIDNLFYNRLDTNTDTLLMGTAPANATASSSQGGTYAVGTNAHTITKGTDGTLYLASQDASDSFVVRCSASCNAAGSWTEAGTAPIGLTNDWNILMPLSGGNILLLNRANTLDDIQSKIWNGSSWSGSWTTIDSNAIENTTYDVGMAATIDHSTGDIYLAYAADNDTFTVADHDLRTAKYTSGSWTSGTAVFTNRAGIGLLQTAISVDSNTSTIYVGYTMRTTPGTAASANVYYATGTAALSSWGAEQGPVNTTSANLYGVDFNIMSDERIYASWFDATLFDILGNTVADISPVVKVSTRGIPTASVTASTSNVYLGGTFVIKEGQTTRNVTDIVISESGTIDAENAIKNVSLYYDLDTTAPYDCASESYVGSESKYGSTDTNGFSSANGVSSFVDVVSIAATQALCVYVAADVTDAALDGSTVRLSVSNPPSDVLVSGGAIATPLIPVGFVAGTNVFNDQLSQGHYQFRNDNGNEAGATSATGGTQDTPLGAIQPNSPKRLRIAVSNEGSISTPVTQFRLEYAVAAPTCDVASSWTDVGATNDAWNMFDSTFVTDGSNTTDIATSTGGTTNENTTFLTPNGGVRDTTSQTGSLTLTNANFVELEYSIVASTTAIEGATYCFRVTNAGAPLPQYLVYPSATISADATLSAAGSQVTSAVIPELNLYVGGKFVIRENLSSRTVTNITITETGSVDGQLNLDNIRIAYDLDTSAPYDCASESYVGGEAQFGAIDTNGFSSANGSSTFAGSVSITTTQSICAYVVLDVVSSALNDDTVKIGIASGGNDITVSSGSVSPSTPVSLTGTTTLSGSVVAQTAYHFRNDNGSETGATSASGGIENTQVTNHSQNTQIRLRLGVSNEGVATSTNAFYRLEFGPKITTCSSVAIWTSVGAAADDWNMFNSPNITEGNNTTNIATSSGGVTDGNTSFLVVNGGLRDTSATTSAITLSSTQFTELEYSITSSALTAFNTTYCFRVSNAGNPLPQYDTYAEITTAPARDFKVQRGDVVITSTSSTLVAGVDYVAPTASSTAFIRITNAHHTGAGRITLGAAQNARDVTAYIVNPTNIQTSVTIARPAFTLNNTRVSWEIVEFIAATGTDNEMIVRSAGSLQMPTASTSATGTAISSVVDDSKVVVFITGLYNRDAGRNVYYAGQITTSWDATNNRPIFTRGAGGAIIDVSYAVVEYTGINWQIQRIEHTYSATNTIETKAIAPVNSLARTFIHSQKRVGALGNVDNFGHEVWLSSIGAVSFRLEAGASTPTSHVSVAWVIENQQTSAGAMKVQRSNGNTTDGTEPVVLAVDIFTPIAALNNSSIFLNTRVVGANSNFPLPMAGASIVSTSSYNIWRSEATGGLLTYRTEIVEWPTNGLAVRQNYYRFYSDNNALIPTDAWPPGPTNLGENTSITALDEPLGDGDRVRLRMTARVANANLPAGLYDFKLQYGQRISSCSAIASWSDVGSTTSGTIWRGYNAPGVTNGVVLSTDPPTGGDLLLSVSDVAGNYVELNPSPTNPYIVEPGEDIEFDWHLEDNGALERTSYCFRMIKSDGATLDGYFNYPQIRTASFTPAGKKWRWYDDTENETPSTPLSAEEVAPIEIGANNPITLRITVDEIKNVQGLNIKFKLQFDESSLFTNPRDVVATSSCVATSTWCYSTGGGVNNTKVTSRVLSDSDPCIASVGIGCGTHNNSPTYTTGDTHPSGALREYSFYLEQRSARVGAVYYFRLYETLNSLPVAPASTSTYPSLVAESATLFLTVSGLPAGTTTAGVVTAASSTPNTIAFGSLPLNTDVNAAHRVTLDTNATQGYRVLTYARQQLINSYNTAIPSIIGSNATPTSWAIGCLSSTTGCVGYHSTDATLSGGSTRFAPLDSYAPLDSTPREIMFGSFPTTDVHDIVYRVRVRSSQPAGDYETEIIYLAIPVY